MKSADKDFVTWASFIVRVFSGKIKPVIAWPLPHKPEISFQTWMDIFETVRNWLSLSVLDIFKLSAALQALSFKSQIILFCALYSVQVDRILPNNPKIRSEFGLLVIVQGYYIISNVRFQQIYRLQYSINKWIAHMLDSTLSP